MQEVEAASEHEEHDVWQGVQTLVLSYVPAGQLSRQASLRGLNLSLEHFVQVMSTVLPSAVERSSEHSPQLVMPPSDTVSHAAHLFPVLSSALGKNPDPHPDAATHVPVEPLSTFKYVLVPVVLHLLHLLLPVAAQAAQFSS